MIMDVARSSGIGVSNTITTGTQREEINKKREALESQAAKLGEILNESKDSVEISDQARALSEAAREIAGVNNTETAPRAARTSAVDTLESRAETAKDYNKVLEEFRAKYGEEEAMRRFDEFMKSEGYERVTVDDANNGIRASGGLSPTERARTPSMWLGDGDHPNIWNKEFSTSNLRTQSSIKADIINGEVKYVASTSANYGAYVNQDVYDALNGLRERNLESAQKDVSFDLDAYMQENFGSNPQTSVVSANTELGSIAANLLKEAGVDLGAEGKIDFSLKGDGSGLHVTGAFEDSAVVQEAINSALRKNPDMLQAFKDEYNRMALSDTSALGGTYNDGVRSVGYIDAQRSFTYSAKEPSAIVMTDFIGVQVSGYNYQKKVSDSFDVNADSTVVVGGGFSLSDPEYDHQRVNRELEEKVQQSMESGEQIGSTMTQAEYDSVRNARQGAFGNESGMFINLGGRDPNAEIYFSGDTGKVEQEAKTAEAKQALRDLESDSRMQKKEIVYRDERQEVRKATASQLLELFASNRRTPGLSMINSIMESLRNLYAEE